MVSLENTKKKNPTAVQLHITASLTKNIFDSSSNDVCITNYETRKEYKSPRTKREQ
jgi:hypothetical protein